MRLLTPLEYRDAYYQLNGRHRPISAAVQEEILTPQLIQVDAERERARAVTRHCDTPSLQRARLRALNADAAALSIARARQRRDAA